MKGFFGCGLLVIGLINVTSQNSGLFGWLATIAGAALLLAALTGPTKKRKYDKTNNGGTDYSNTNAPSGSGFSGGDGGGGD